MIQMMKTQYFICKRLKIKHKKARKVKAQKKTVKHGQVLLSFKLVCTSTLNNFMQIAENYDHGIMELDIWTEPLILKGKYSILVMVHC